MRHAYHTLSASDIGVTWLCLRFYPKHRDPGDDRPKGPTIHENSTHSLAGGDVEVSITEEGLLALEIHDLPPGVAIGFLGFTPDESLSVRGVEFGPSGGNRMTRITVSISAPDEPNGRKVLNLKAPAHYEKIAGEYSNVWIKAEHDLSAARWDDEQYVARMRGKYGPEWQSPK